MADGNEQTEGQIDLERKMDKQIQFPPFAYIRSYDGFFLFSIFRNFAIISRNK